MELFKYTASGRRTKTETVPAAIAGTTTDQDGLVVESVTVQAGDYVVRLELSEIERLANAARIGRMVGRIDVRDLDAELRSLAASLTARA